MSQVNLNLACVHFIEPQPSASSTSSSSATTAQVSAPTPASAQSSSAILKNSKDAYLEAARILLVLLENVLKHPTEPKYRTIRCENKAIKKKLLSLVGCSELLAAIGFRREANNSFQLPAEVPLQQVQQYRDVLKARREAWLKDGGDGQVQAAPAVRNAVNLRRTRAAAAVAEPVRTYFPLQLIASTMPYLQRIRFPRSLVRFCKIIFFIVWFIWNIFNALLACAGIYALSFAFPSVIFWSYFSINFFWFGFLLMFYFALDENGQDYLNMLAGLVKCCGF